MKQLMSDPLDVGQSIIARDNDDGPEAVIFSDRASTPYTSIEVLTLEPPFVFPTNVILQSLSIGHSMYEYAIKCDPDPAIAVIIKSPDLPYICMPEQSSSSDVPAQFTRHAEFTVSGHCSTAP